MRVLVAYGTKRAGNEALARAVGNGLEAAGHSVDVIAATKVDALDRWDAVIVGGAPHAWFWHRHSQRFIKRDVEDLFAAQPPLIIRMIEAAAPVSEPEEPVAVPLEPRIEDERRPRPRERLVHRLVLWLCLFSGVTAVAGGISVLLMPFDFAPDAWLLGGYLLPGLVLVLVVGLGNLAAAALEALQIARSELAVSAAGAALSGWIVVQLVMLHSVSWLQLIYFGVGLTTVLGALWLWRERHHLSALERGVESFARCGGVATTNA